MTNTKACEKVNVNGHNYIREDLVPNLDADKEFVLAQKKDEGMDALLERRVLLMCSNYFYEGILVEYTSEDAILIDAAIVYETGPWTEKKWKDRQALPGPVGVKIHAVESFQEAPSLIV